MAGTLVPTLANPAQPGILRNTGLIAITLVATGATYATATGGWNVPLATLFTAGSGGITYQKTINPLDIVAIFGYTTDGYLVTGALNATTNTTLNIRLFTSGASEIADGTPTKTATILILLGGGGYN